MHDLPATRRSLLLDLARHSDLAWEEFLRIYEQALLRFCRARGLQEADACDVVQDVLAAVARKLPEWDHDRTSGAFRAWVFRVARNRSLDLLVQRARAPRQADSFSALVCDPQQMETEFDLACRKTVFEHAAALVRDEVRDVTWRCFHETAVQGRKSEQVAAGLGISVGSVYTAKCRVLARLRDRVAQLQENLLPASSDSTENMPQEER